MSTEGLLTAESSYASYQLENIKIWVYILSVRPTSSPDHLELLKARPDIQFFIPSFLFPAS